MLVLLIVISQRQRMHDYVWLLHRGNSCDTDIPPGIERIVHHRNPHARSKLLGFATASIDSP